MDTPVVKSPVSRRGEPAWEIAAMFPEQGYWDEHTYFKLPNNRGLEFNDGMIEVLPVPTRPHELIAGLICELIKAFIVARSLGGIVLTSGYKLRIPSRKFRQPDVIYLTAEQNAASNDNFATASEIVVEVVSPDDPNRDYAVKREEYAMAGVPEYWIVDRAEKHILVLSLEGGKYIEHGRFVAGQHAVSKRLAGFTVSVDEVLKLG